MKKYIIFIVIYSLQTIVFGQSNDTQENINTLQKKFTQQELHAYNQKGSYKLKDFYEYLTQYSQSKDDSLRTEIKKNIFHILQSKEDITLQLKDTLYHNNEVWKTLEEKEYQFNTSEEKLLFYGNTFWTIQYKLTYNINNTSHETTIYQNIFLSETEKLFGTNRKKVWSVLLGNTE